MVQFPIIKTDKSSSYSTVDPFVWAVDGHAPVVKIPAVLGLAFGLAVEVTVSEVELWIMLGSPV
jgi:hypothetical protein